MVLTEHNKKQVYVPPNCGHGFFTFEDDTCALYLQEGCFNPAKEACAPPLPLPGTPETLRHTSDTTPETPET